MAKGRTFVPSKEKEGNWNCEKDEKLFNSSSHKLSKPPKAGNLTPDEDSAHLQRHDGKILNWEGGIWKAITREFSTRGWPRTLDVTKPQERRVASPPTRFNSKHEVPFRRFAFSTHDNRHTFQDQGEYFGNGLGRRTFPDRCQHYSNNLITWETNNDPRSCYMASYQGLQGDDNSRYRRFPRVHLEGKPGSAPSETTTTKWFRQPDVPYKTPLHVLAITQEPFLTPNKWAYSYRPIWY